MVDGSTLSATVTGLTNGTAYTFTVTATNAAGTSDPAAPSAAVTPVGVPNPPTGVIAVAGDAEATVTWSAPASDGGSPITEYTVVSDPGGVTAVVDGATLTSTVTGLTNGIAYTFRVTATNAAGTSNPSAPSSAVTIGLPPPTVSVGADVSVDEGDAGMTAAADVIVTLSDTRTFAVSVQYETSDGDATVGGDYSGASGATLVIPAGSATGTIQVLVYGDDVYEDDETFSLILTASAGATISPTAASTTIAILDDDPMPTLSVADVTVSESALAAEVAVTLTGKTALGATVDFTTSDTSTPPSASTGTDYQSTGGTITFEANTSTASVAEVIQVVIAEDSTDEFNEGLLVQLFGAVDATIVDGEALLTIVDDDPAPRLTIWDQTSNEGTGNATVTVNLVGASSGGVSVEVVTAGGTATPGLDYASTSTSVTWAPDESGDKTAAVTLIDDGDVEGAEYVTLQLRNATTSGPSAEGVVVDYDLAVLKIIDDEAPHLTEVPGLSPWGMAVLVAALGGYMALRSRAARARATRRGA